MTMMVNGNDGNSCPMEFKISLCEWPASMLNLHLKHILEAQLEMLVEQSPHEKKKGVELFLDITWLYLLAANFIASA